MKHHVREAGRTLPIAMIEPQLFMVCKECFPVEHVSSVVKHCPMLSKYKLENELFVVHRNDTMPT
jgi:hypothetical protein